MLKSLFSILILFNVSLVCRAEQAATTPYYPEVNQPCPELTINNIMGVGKKSMNISEFKGKWLLLDFWSVGCSACVAAFPKLNKIRESFKDNLQVLLVGQEDPGNRIRNMYKRFESKMDLKLTTAFDSTLTNRLDLYSFPYIVVLDDKGIVRAVTASIDSIALAKLMKGEDANLWPARRAHQESFVNYDYSKDFISNYGGKLGSDELSHSMLSRWKPGMPILFPSLQSFKEQGFFDASAVRLNWLYNFAYFGVGAWGGVRASDDDALYGNYWEKPLLELEDSSVFKIDDSVSNLFCYSLVLPKDKITLKNIQHALQSDLQTSFGYRVTTEMRMMPYYKLVALDKKITNLKTKGGTPSINGDRHASFYGRNINIQSLIANLYGHNPYGPPFVDETGIDYNIDLNLDCVFTNINDIRRELNKHSLDLILSSKMMNVIVIKD